MAVDARHLNLLPPRLINPNRDFAFSNQGNGNGLGAYNNVQRISGGSGGSGIPMIPAIAEVLLPNLHFQTLACESVQPKTSMNTDNSGLTYNVPPAPRKRSRDSFDQFNNLPANYFVASQQKSNNNNDVGAQFPSFVGEQILPFMNENQLDIDAIVSQHTKKIRLELEERRKQHGRALMPAIGEGVMKRMKEKDEQIQRIGKLNLTLQEKVKSLYVENQLWRDLAQTNQATANSLRTNLEQVLMHVRDECHLSAGAGCGGAAGVEEDAESCCGSSDHGNDAAADDETPAEWRNLVVGAQDKREAHVSHQHNNRMCKMCGEGESCVLLLPCRHLCLCIVCGSTLLHTCPVCNSSMNATVHVNLSSRSNIMSS